MESIDRIYQLGWVVSRECYRSLCHQIDGGGVRVCTGGRSYQDETSQFRHCHAEDMLNNLKENKNSANQEGVTLDHWRDDVRQHRQLLQLSEWKHVPFACQLLGK